MLPDTLHTPRLILRPLAPADAPTIFESYGRDPEVTRFTTWAPHASVADTLAFVTACAADAPETARTYAVCDRADGGLRGTFNLRRAMAHHLIYALARRWWGQGLMTEVLTAAVDWTFADPRHFRISAVCDVENVGSARVMEKAGLVREGVLRRWLVHPCLSDQPRDCLLYAKVR
jgi:RimJ/RimL family protein N-acetyltransferase